MTDEEQDHRRDVLVHIFTVRECLDIIADELGERGFDHDNSKLEEPEFSGYQGLSEAVKGLAYGSMAYRAAFAPYKEVIQHHYQHNDHHPEWVRRNEEWREVLGYEGIYEVSNFGEVRSLTRETKRPGKQGDMIVKGKILSSYVTPKGYLRIQLSKNNTVRNYLVHVLVAIAFIPNPDNKAEVNHKNGDKKDNHIDNLEWSTPSENLTHAYETGLRESNAKYVVFCDELDLVTVGAVKMVEALRAKGYENANLGAIYNCITGACHTHLGLVFTSVNLENYTPPSDISKMNLMQITEMLCDWKAASTRNSQTLLDTLEVTVTRFKIEEPLAQILRNTVVALGW